MQSFKYRAVHPSGRIQKGKMDAANANDLVSFLKGQNLDLIEAKAVTKTTASLSLSRLAPKLWQRERPSAKQLALFCRQVSDLMTAGLPFIEALTCVTQSLGNSPLCNRLPIVINDIRSGDHVFEAFGRHPDHFPHLFLTILEAGETAGDLRKAFADLSRQLAWQSDIADETRRALRYPLFLLSVACAVTSFMMLFVVPQIVEFLASVEASLPLSTRLLIKGAKAFAAFWWCLPLLLLSGWTSVILLRKRGGSMACKIDRVFLRLPAVGPLILSFSMARLASSLALLLQSGLPISNAVSKAAHTTSNFFLEKKIHEANAQLMAGTPLSRGLSDLLPPLPLQILKIGENSGSLTHSFNEMARGFEKEAKDGVASFLGLLEPSLTILVGALLAWIVLAVLGPVYGSLAPLSRGM